MKHFEPYEFPKCIQCNSNENVDVDEIQSDDNTTVLICRTCSIEWKYDD